MSDIAHVRHSRATADLAAQKFNALHNPVRHRTECGEYLLDILNTRFGGDLSAFKFWCTRELDASWPSVQRYLALARHADKIPTGAVVLDDVYKLLGLAAKPDLD